MKIFHLHLVSDSTGETVSAAARASLVHFDNIQAEEHVWRMIRDTNQMKEVIAGIKANRGFVLYTIVNDEFREALEEGCRKLKVPCVPLLDTVVAAMGNFFNVEAHAQPGRQHIMDAEYFDRIEAIHYVLSHDDGRSMSDLNKADVIVAGISRTTKTPTCIYLANRGVKAANIPIVPGCPLPPELSKATFPLIVGLTCDAKKLIQIRKHRLRMVKQNEKTDYVDIKTVSEEIDHACRFFEKHKWPVIDVTRISIEEIAATILQMYSHRLKKLC